MISNQCCPAAQSFTDIPAEGCSVNFGQRQKFIFQRLYDGGTRNGIADGTSTGEAGLLATWTALKAATDSSKIVVSPFIENPADDGGDARTYGGGNETLNGVPINIGRNPVNVSCRMNGKKQDVIKAMKKLECEAQAHNLGVYSINENGQIEGIKETVGTTSTWYPVPIEGLYVGDKKHGDFDGPDYNELQFSYIPGYSDDLDILTLDASALSL